MAKDFIHLGELIKRVDGQHIFLWHLVQQPNMMPLLLQNVRNIGQVILPSRVIRAEAMQGGKQGFSIKAVVTGIDLGDPQLLVGRVFLFHDGSKLTRSVTNNPTVPRGVIDASRCE